MNSMRPSDLCRLLSCLIVTIACAREKSLLATPVIDTLPGGTITVTNPGPHEWADSSGWQLIGDLQITGDSSGPGQLNRPWMLAVDPLGRLYVSDETIKLFDASGRFVRTVGRLGEGPGEYRDAMLTTAGTDLIVQDPTLARLTVFDSAGNYRRSWRTECCYIRQPGATSAGEVIIWAGTGEAPGQFDVYVRYGLDGSPREAIEVLSPPTGKTWSVSSGAGGFTTPVPFSPVFQVAMPRSGGIIYGLPTEYAVVWSRTGRDTALIFRRPGMAQPLGRARRQTAVNTLKNWYLDHQENFGGLDPDELDRTMKLDDVPLTAPAFKGIDTDWEGNIWITVDPGEDSLRTHYDIFTPQGIYRGSVIVPVLLRGSGRTVWSSDYVFSALQTPEGIPTIQRFRIQKEVQEPGY